MKLLVLSARLFIFGFFCDLCADICTHITEKKLKKNKPLNGKLLTAMSNLSNNSLVKWQKIEKRFISLTIRQRAS